MILKAKTFIPLLNLFFKRLILFNKKRTKNIDEIKIIKDACETITKKLQKRKKRNKKIISTPVKKKNLNEQYINNKKRNNTKTFKKTRFNRRKNVRIRSKLKIKNYFKKKKKR